jgi:hypothetical protein
MIGTNYSALTKGVLGRIPNQNTAGLLNSSTTLRSVLGAALAAGLTAANKQRAAASDLTNREPAHGTWCNALGGVFLRVTSTGAGSVVRMQHPLNKTPQGVIWVKPPSARSYLILTSDVSNGDISNSEWAYFYMGGPQGEEAIGVVF